MHGPERGGGDSDSDTGEGVPFCFGFGLVLHCLLVWSGLVLLGCGVGWYLLRSFPVFCVWFVYIYVTKRDIYVFLSLLHCLDLIEIGRW